MSNEDQKKDGVDRSDKLSGLRLHRRRFLQALGLISGGVLANTGPMIKAARGAIAAPPRVFDISLPASYNVDEPSEIITVALNGYPEVPVDFHTVAAVSLDPTSNPDVASVRLVSFTMTSNDPNPFGVVGIDTGVVTAQVPGNTVIGQLNLADGTMTEHSFPITVSFERNRQPFSSMINPTLAVVTETAQVAPAQQTTKKKCNKKNDVDLEIKTPLEMGTGFGTLNLGMDPSVQTIEPQPIGQ